MLPWLLRLLNVPDDVASHLDEATVSFQHPRTLIGGLILLAPLALFIYLRQKRNLPSVPTGLRLTLSATRVLILLLLVLVLGSPILKLDHKSENKPIVALMFDHSQSMRLPAGTYDENEFLRIAEAAGYKNADNEARKALGKIGRAKLAQTVIKNGGKPVLDALAKKYDLRFYAFGRDVERLGVDPANPDLPEPPNPGSPATHLGDAIGHVLDESAGRQVAAVVLFTDGQNTGGRSPADAAQAAAAAGVPVYTVPAGSSRRLQDVAIVDLFATGLVSVGDTARVAVTLEASSDFERRPTKVELRDGDQLLDSKDIVLRSTEQMQVELTFKATQPGARYLTVHVPPQPEEPEELRGNNADTALVRISDEKIKVLYVEGPPRWDFRFLKNAMRRDNGLAGRAGKEPDIVVETEWRRRTAAERAAALPRTLDQLAEYHAVILGDASPKLLDPEFLTNLDKAVRERGVGLIVEAGPLAMPHRFGDPFDALLPVRLKRGAPGQYPRGLPSFRLELAPEGTLHEAMRFYDEPGRNANAWEQMPRYFWCAAAERASDGATVLAYNPIPTGYGKMPLIAQHYAGQGKVLFVGTDSTWLWRQNVGDRFFYKFWGQAIRAVARLDANKAKKSRVEVRPVRLQPGEPAQVELQAFAVDGMPRTDDKLSVQIQGGGTASAVEVLADPAVKGRYLGRFTPPTAGDYRLTYAPGSPVEPTEARLRAAVAPEEMRQPNVNRPALELLAAASAGGALVELPDLGVIPDKLAGESKFTELHREASLWDNGLTLGLLIFLYSIDVGLRRLLGLS